MLLGILFSSDDFFGFDKFHFFGFLGYVVFFLYFLLIYNCINNKIYYFHFSICLLLIYLSIVIFVTIKLKCNITTFNLLWHIPFLLCVIVEGTIYLIKRKKNKFK